MRLQQCPTCLFTPASPGSREAATTRVRKERRHLDYKWQLREVGIIATIEIRNQRAENPTSLG